MRTRVSIFTVVALALVLITATGASAAGDRSLGKKGMFSPAVERLEGSTLALDVKAPYERAELVLRGPQGVRVKREFKDGESISLRLTDESGAPLANGRYSYTLRLSPRPEKGSAFKTGMFFVENGGAVSRQTLRAELGRTREALNMERFERAKQKRAERRELSRQPRSGSKAGNRPPASERPNNPELYANYSFAWGVEIYDFYPYNPYLLFFEYGNGFYYYAGAIYTYGFYGPYPTYNYFYNSLSTYGQVWNNVYGGYATWVSAPYNITWGFGNYDFAFGLGYDYAGYSVDFAFYGHLGIDFYGNNRQYAYGYAYNGVPGPGGYHLLLGGKYDGGYSTFNYSYLTVGPYGVGVYQGGLRVERGDGVTPNIRFSSLDAGQRWLFQNNKNSGVFAIRDETAGNSPFRLKPGAPENGLAIETDGRLTTSTGAFLSAGGVWTDASSRKLKEDVQDLSLEEALAVLAELDPVKFKYRGVDERHLGFIAEDVPELVATAERSGLSSMDIVAVLTEVLQHQQAVIERLHERLAQLEESSSQP